jgi:hypothetical protein
MTVPLALAVKMFLEGVRASIRVTVSPSFISTASCVVIGVVLVAFTIELLPRLGFL